MTGGLEFAIALVVFFLSHAIPTMRPVRAVLVGRLGERAYLALYGALSVVLLLWLVSAAGRAPYIALWTPARWHALVPIVVMPIAFALAGAGLAAPNPLSLNFRK